MTTRTLGRMVPKDFDHVAKYPYQALAANCFSLEKIIRMPWYMPMNQGSQGACVGFGCSGMMSILNGRQYDPFWLWTEAKKIDDWAGTAADKDPNRGTTVRAALDVLRNMGHARQVFYPINQVINRPAVITEGVLENRWAGSIDDIRDALYHNIPVAFGANWYSSFDNPVAKDGRMWIGLEDLGYLRGGHCICLIGGSDLAQAACFVNSWGIDYPRITWISYKVLESLLINEGEATLVTDRPER